MEIRNLMNQEMSKSEISRTLGIDRKTVSKYADFETGPEYSKIRERIHKIDPYTEYIKHSKTGGIFLGMMWWLRIFLIDCFIIQQF